MRLRETFAWLAPEETCTQKVMPVTLLLRAGPMMALIVLGVNDHVLKGAGLLPGALTGKLSDFAGLFFFPLLLVTVVNLAAKIASRFSTMLLPLASPNRDQVFVACITTGVFFSAVQLWTPIADFYSVALAQMQIWHNAPRVAVTQDPLDLIALPSLCCCYYWSLDGLRRFPPGRLALMRAAGRDPSIQIEDLNVHDRMSKFGIRDIYALHSDDGRSVLEELCEGIRFDLPEHEIDTLLIRLRVIAQR